MKQRVTFACSGAVGLSFVILSFWIDSDVIPRCLHLATILCALATGWLVGIALSPYTTKESEQFPKAAAAFSAFGSGYVLSKLDRAMDTVFTASALSSPSVTFRIMAAVSVFFVSMIVTYVCRAYMADSN